MELSPQGAVRRHGRPPSTPPPATRWRSAPRCSWSRRTRTTHERACRCACRTDGAARAGHDLRGRPARRPAERDGAGPDRGQGRARSAACSPPGCRSSRPRSFVHPRWVPQLADAEDLMTPARATPAATCRCWCPTSAASTGRSSSAAATSRSSAAPPRPSRRRTSTAPSTSSSRCSSPTVRRARDAGLDVRAYVSMCFGDPWEGAVPVEQVVARRQAALRPRRQPAQPRRHHRRRHRRPRDRAGRARFAEAGMAHRRPRHALPRHLRPGAGQRLRRRCSAGITTYDASAGGLGGCPYAKSATGNLATEDLVWMLTGLGIEHGVDLDALVATSAWMAGHLGRPSPSAVVRALAATAPGRPGGRRPDTPCTDSGGAAVGLTAESGHEPEGVPAHRCAQDRHDVPPGPARASTPKRWPPTTSTSRPGRRW